MAEVVERLVIQQASLVDLVAVEQVLITLQIQVHREQLTLEAVAEVVVTCRSLLILVAQE
jgi:hypothetical protein